MKLKPGRVILALILLFLLVWGVRSFISYRSPPRLDVTVAARVPAGQLYGLHVTSSKDVLMTLQAGGIVLDNAGADWSVHLPAAEGAQQLELTVTDRAGNVVTRELNVTGVAAPQLRLLAGDSLMAGDALAAWLQVTAGEAVVDRATISLDGEPLATVEFLGGLAAFAAVPFEAGGRTMELTATVTDEFGQDHSESLSWTVAPIDRAVELLQLSADTLALRSDDNQAAQADRLAEAMSSLQPEPLWREPFLTPAEGWSSSGYADPRQYEPGGAVSYHLGADFAAPTGTPVYATNDGIVLLAEGLEVAGNTIVIDHGAGITSRYYHLETVEVAAGQRVARGDRIAEVGSTGLSTGPHLHWEMRIGTEPSNPLPWSGNLLPDVSELR